MRGKQTRKPLLGRRGHEGGQEVSISSIGAMRQGGATIEEAQRTTRRGRQQKSAQELCIGRAELERARQLTQGVGRMRDGWEGIGRTQHERNGCGGVEVAAHGDEEAMRKLGLILRAQIERSCENAAEKADQGTHGRKYVDDCQKHHQQ